VDRLPSAELIDVILSQSAYGLELRGARFQQARENLKKLRSLMRRIQNRGYGTLARIAAHLDRLAVGDEANAAIDAFDAVNLMTVHAAKGLEFPVVFVVNLARGSGNRRDPVRLTADPAGGTGSVAIGDFQSDADDDHAAREREETKRLMYVALTRARDRLYLGTVLKDGVMQPGRGSLGDVLPVTLRATFSATTGVSEWRSSSGSVHPFRVCSPAADPAETGKGKTPATADGHPRIDAARSTDDFAPLIDPTPAPNTVGSAMAAAFDRPERPPHPPAGGSDRIVGTLVHRMLERFGFTTGDDPAVASANLLQLLESHEVLTDTTAVSANDLVGAALRAYRTICDRSDVRSLYLTGSRWHEVPFTMRRGESLWRGTIDCLIQTSPTTMTVLEFKTGKPRPEHEVQLELYKDAAALLFPGMTIETCLVYPLELAVLSGLRDKITPGTRQRLQNDEK
jgi:ATP-dependent helicase/nuclease subunit A